MIGKGDKLEAFECSRCGGRGHYFDWSNAVLSMYEPIGFSKARLRQARRDYDNAKHTCPACNGRGVIFEPVRS